MKMRKMMQGMLWGMAGLLGACGVLRAAAPETVPTAGDTIRLSWDVASGEEKSFTFAGTADAAFVVEWGDGVRSRFKGRGEVEPVTARHTYRLGKRYDVRFYGLPEKEEIAWEGFTETAGGMELPMVLVKGGTFQMGCTDEQYGQCNANESPVHAVTLDDYYIGMYKVTQPQWEVVMGKSFYEWRDSICYGCDDGKYIGDDYPVYALTWYEATAFCEKLSALTGKTYRLPTEAEWEYAARGGHKPDGTRYSGSDIVSEVAGYFSDAAPVGQKKPNGIGLYDMSGNVSEWCYDSYSANYYAVSPEENPQGPSATGYRVKRGGGSAHSPESCRVSYRFGAYVSTPDYRGGDTNGFRVVCEP